jgi:hypothetical protein
MFQQRVMNITHFANSVRRRDVMPKERGVSIVVAIGLSVVALALAAGWADACPVKVICGTAVAASQASTVSLAGFAFLPPNPWVASRLRPTHVRIRRHLAVCTEL